MKKHYKTIVISDVHLGTEGSKAKELVKFLKANTCDRLILNGDIIDGWQLKKNGKWKKSHTRFFKRIIQMIEAYNTDVIYLRGNHDDFLDHIIPFRIGSISIQLDYILESGTKKYYVVHGDVFDTVTTNLKWIAKLGDIGYTFLLWLNQRYNNYRLKRGLPYYSLSQAIKAKVKKAVSYISDYENQLLSLAEIKKCDGIICGHIHQPAMKTIGNLEYMNSGDWVESLSALVENYEGQWEIVYYQDRLVEEGDEADDDEPDEVPIPNLDVINALKNR
ncbi:MAG TPA: UDP-2,3-diacylglucosamine diphosphatase [Bacteroidia bacterium]|nr:UDP-2,3-diacylglucosamine diphosphatase [Bacteroidia bacterium]